MGSFVPPSPTRLRANYMANLKSGLNSSDVPICKTVLGMSQRAGQKFFICPARKFLHVKLGANFWLDFVTKICLGT
jgi:hypothetical protein